MVLELGLAKTQQTPKNLITLRDILQFVYLNDIKVKGVEKRKLLLECQECELDIQEDLSFIIRK